tara:strand:- start:84 stop:491 length:408 start_codon:yes stop_codon:yes gene_type:complete
MYTNETNIRVRYAETDQMGYVYYGVYAQYYEVGRVELLRSIGLSYKKLEEKGFSLPVLDFTIKYKKPAFYDDELIIKTTVSTLPSTKIDFEYETYNSKKQLLNIGKVTLVFVNKLSSKPCNAPGFLLDLFKKRFS